MPTYYRHDGCKLTTGDPVGYWGLIEFKCDCGAMRKRPYMSLDTSADPNSGPQASDQPKVSETVVQPPRPTGRRPAVPTTQPPSTTGPGKPATTGPKPSTTVQATPPNTSASNPAPPKPVSPSGRPPPKPGDTTVQTAPVVATGVKAGPKPPSTPSAKPGAQTGTATTTLTPTKPAPTGSPSAQGQGTPSIPPVSDTAQTVAAMLGAHPLSGVGSATPQPKPQATGTKDLRERNESIKATVAGLGTLTAEQKRDRAAQAASKVSGMRPEQIKAMSTADGIKALAELTCHKVTIGGGKPKVPSGNQAALTKLYANMQIDKEFLADDRGRRERILNELTKPGGKFASARDTWGTANELATSTTKQKLLSDFQAMQGAALDVPLDPMQFLPLAKGNSGLCSGKLVKVSTHPSDNATFDETINTVDHETTHAYQHELIAQLDSGALGVDDPRYAQAMLFKLNQDTYMGSPAALSELDRKNPTKKAKYDEEYAAYKHQPMEEHAWKAGDEAGRAFDVEAVKLEMAGVGAAMQKHLPETARARAAEVATKFDGAKTLMDRLDLLGEVDDTAAVAYEEVRKATLPPAQASYISPNQFGGYIDSYNEINKGSDPARKKLVRMAALHEVVIADANGYKAFKPLYDATNGLLPDIGSYVTGGYETFAKRRRDLANRSDSFAARVPDMRQLHREMQDATERGKPLVQAWTAMWKTFTSDKKLTNGEIDELNRIRVLEVCSADKALQLKTSEALAAARQRNGIT